MDNRESKRVLIVDDMNSMRRTIKTLLVEAGFNKELIVEMDLAGSAYKYIQTEGGVDFIVTDWNMPDYTGVQLVQQIREMEAYKNVPILMVTAEATRAQVVEAVTAGVNEYLIKPFSPKKFFDKISSIYAEE